MSNLIKVTIFCALVLASNVANFWAGGEYERMKQELVDAHVQSRCYAKDKFEAFVAKDGVDYACFKQNIETKKISKSLIVLEGN